MWHRYTDEWVKSQVHPGVPESHANGHRHIYPHAYGDIHAYTYGNIHSYFYSNSYRHGDLYTYAYTYSNTDAYTRHRKSYCDSRKYGTG